LHVLDIYILYTIKKLKIAMKDYQRAWKHNVGIKQYIAGE